MNQIRLTMIGSGSYKSSLSFRLIDLGRRLGQKYDVTMILPAADKYNDFTPDKQASLSELYLVQPWQPATRSQFINLIPYVFTSLVALFRSRPEVIYLYKPTPISIIGILPRLLLRTPVIVDIDDLGSAVMKLEKQPALHVKMVAACEYIARRFSSAVVVSSSYLARNIATEYPYKPLLVLSNGSEPTTFSRRAPAPLRNHIFYLGALNRLDLIEPLLLAVPAILTAHPDTSFTVMGDGRDLESAKQLARKLGIISSITFTGWVSKTDAAQLTAFGDIAICYQPDTPTVRAASNMKLFDYMAMSAVPVVSDVGDLRQITDDGRAGIAVPADDSRALSKAIVDLLDNPKRRVAIAKTARRYAETIYSWQTLAAILDNFISMQLPLAYQHGNHHIEDNV